MNKFMKIMMVASAFSEWLMTATADGEIDEDEMVDFMKTVLKVAGISVKYKIPME